MWQPPVDGGPCPRHGAEFSRKHWRPSRNPPRAGAPPPRTSAPTIINISQDWRPVSKPSMHDGESRLCRPTPLHNQTSQNLKRATSELMGRHLFMVSWRLRSLGKLTNTSAKRPRPPLDGVTAQASHETSDAPRSLSSGRSSNQRARAPSFRGGNRPLDGGKGLAGIVHGGKVANDPIRDSCVARQRPLGQRGLAVTAHGVAAERLHALVANHRITTGHSTRSAWPSKVARRLHSGVLCAGSMDSPRPAIAASGALAATRKRRDRGTFGSKPVQPQLLCPPSPTRVLG